MSSGNGVVGPIKVKDVMTYLVVTFHPNESVVEAARRLVRNRISGAPVVEYGKVIGIVSEADLVRACMKGDPFDAPHDVLGTLSGLMRDETRARAADLRVEDVMTRDAVTVDMDATVNEAAELLDRYGIRRLPVVQDGYLVGIIARADIVRVVASTQADSELAG